MPQELDWSMLEVLKAKIAGVSSSLVPRDSTGSDLRWRLEAFGVELAGNPPVQWWAIDALNRCHHMMLDIDMEYICDSVVVDNIPRHLALAAMNGAWLGMTWEVLDLLDPRLMSGEMTTQPCGVLDLQVSAQQWRYLYPQPNHVDMYEELGGESGPGLPEASAAGHAYLGRLLEFDPDTVLGATYVYRVVYLAMVAEVGKRLRSKGLPERAAAALEAIVRVWCYKSLPMEAQFMASAR